MIKTNDIQIVIGSWGSYNKCNERALGSKWICLNNYEDWEEIEKELNSQGFELDGIDEELFIQDIENFPCDSGVNWDYVHPKTLFELLKKSGILDDDDKYERAEIFCEIEGYQEWKRRVEEDEEDWIDEFTYVDENGEVHEIEKTSFNVPEWLLNIFGKDIIAR